MRDGFGPRLSFHAKSLLIPAIAQRRFDGAKPRRVTRRRFCWQCLRSLHLASAVPGRRSRSSVIKSARRAAVPVGSPKDAR